MSSKQTILLADDEPVVLNMISELIQEYNYNVVTATNGADAVAQFYAHRNTITLCVTDLSMPKLTGDQVLRQIRAIAPRLPFIIISGFMCKGLEIDAELFTALEKPLNLDLFIQTVQQMLQQPEHPCG